MEKSYPLVYRKKFLGGFMQNKKRYIFIVLSIVCLIGFLALIMNKGDGNKFNDYQNSPDPIEKDENILVLTESSYIVKLNDNEERALTYKIHAENYNGDIATNDILVQIEYVNYEDIELVPVEGMSSVGTSIQGWVKKSTYESMQSKIADGTINDLPPNAVYYLMDKNGSTMLDENGGPITAKFTDMKLKKNNASRTVKLSVPYNQSATLAELLSGEFDHLFSSQNTEADEYVITLWINEEPVLPEELGISFDFVMAN